MLRIVLKQHVTPSPSGTVEAATSSIRRVSVFRLVCESPGFVLVVRVAGFQAQESNQYWP